MTKLTQPPSSTTSRRILTSVSSTALVMMLAAAGSAFEQADQKDGEIVTLNAPISVAGAPVVIGTNNDVTVNNNTAISPTDVTQIIQINSDTYEGNFVSGYSSNAGLIGGRIGF